MIINITNKEIKQIFERANHQMKYVIGLYNLATEKAGVDVNKVSCFPFFSINENMHKLIFGKAIDFDKTNHPSVIAGGAWLNYGFNSSNLLDGQCEVPVDKIEMKQ